MYNASRLWLSIAVLFSLLLAACGGGGGGGNGGGATATAPAAPAPMLGYGIKTLQFSWPAVSGATHYRLFENPDGGSGYVQVGGDLTATSVDHTIALHRRLNASYIVSACNGAGCADSSPIALAANLIPAIGYAKASNTGAGDHFGAALALSADGNTLAVGAKDEASAATGIDGNQADNTAGAAGAVYVFARNGATWIQQAYVKASNTAAGDNFGAALALSADGNTLAVGAIGEDSVAAGSGAVYVFARSGAAWTQQAFVKASNAGVGDQFGTALALSADGNTLAVGAPLEASAATGIDGDQANNTVGASGAVYVFTRSANNWTQQAYVKASNTGASDFFGTALALSADGNTLAVGAYRESSSATGVGGNQTDNTAGGSGAVYVFAHSGATWTQQAYVKASNTGAADHLGTALALSADGNTLAVGAVDEDSAATGVDGNQADGATNSGAVYVFTRNVTTWTQQAYVKASNTEAGDNFGSALALSADGNTLAVGASLEDSVATGVGGNQADNSAGGGGAVYVFSRSATTWTQQAYVKASNAGVSDQYGIALALSADGNTLAVGANGEDSVATGIDGDQANNTAAASGALYLY